MESDLHTLKIHESRTSKVILKTKVFFACGHFFMEAMTPIAHCRAFYTVLTLQQALDGQTMQLYGCSCSGMRWNYIITFVWRQADWPNEVSKWHAIIESQQGHVVIKIAVAEFLGNCTQHESRLRSHAVITSIMLTKCHLNHEPHKSFHAMSGCDTRGFRD